MLNNKIIIFDFDGVIVDSHRQRSNSFRYALQEFDGELVERFIEYHTKNGGLSRFEKFKYFFEEMVQLPITNTEILNYAYKVSSYVKEKITLESVDPKILDLIKSHKFDKHIVSASMDVELKWICRNLGIDKYFITINGSQNVLTTKAETVQTLIAIFDYDPKNVVLIGDAIQDYQAAIANNIEFLGYNFNTELNINHLNF